MVLRIVYTIFFLFLTTVFILLFTGHSNGPVATVNQGYTGAPGETGTVCGNCHNLSGSYGNVFVDARHPGVGGILLEYDPTGLNEYIFTVNMTSGSPAGYGFQAIVMNHLTGNPVSVNYVNLSPNLKVSTLSNGRKYIEHDGTSTSNVFSFGFIPDYPTHWGAPDLIAIHFAATAVNGDGLSSGNSGSQGFLITQSKLFLPVTLAVFDAVSTPAGIHLNWTTETEQDNDYFTIEHSIDGSNFTTLKTTPGAGTSDRRNAYSYTHKTPAKGNNYYRLRMVDFDGKETFSDSTR